MPGNATLTAAVDALWRTLNRPDTASLAVIGDDASLTLACLTDLAYWQHGREIDFQVIPGGFRVSIGDPVER